MIIKMTVRDNDFSPIIEGFCRDFIVRMYELHPDCCINENDYEALKAWRKRDVKIRKLLNPNNDIVLTEEDKETIINQVKYVFGLYVKKWCYKDSEYLIERFEVSIIDSVEDKWENGEMFYWFQHAGKTINL